jgi:FKBP-type peptidyl-prolyl cis-trans isomerase SlyD
MNITDQCVVTLDYAVHDSQGETVSEPSSMTYLHGVFGEMFPRMETALSGKAVGDKVDVYLQPDDAFGDYDAELLRVEPRTRFPQALEVGMEFEGIPGESVQTEGKSGEDAHGMGVSDDAAPRIYRVTDIADGSVVLDGNHPLAGMSLRFMATVTSIRRATQEELERGEADGKVDGMMLSAS